MEWRPIETVPRDRTSVLLTCAIDECWGGNTAVAAWWGDKASGAWVCYMNMVLDPELHFTPTHWMPLPEPPGSDEGTCK